VARSIHETRRDLEEARLWEFSDGSAKGEALWILEERLARKRRYKYRATLPTSTHAAVPVDAKWLVEVVVEDEGPHIHHPLSPADIHGLLATLPVDVRPELRRVRCSLGRHEDAMNHPGAEPDPFTGRPGYAYGPIWEPALQGRFRPLPAEIDLFAYVLDMDGVRVPEILTALLWVQQAHTLAHEVAHGWDRTGRRGKDRWAADQQIRAEEYAEGRADGWLVSVAVPYFRLNHPGDATAFEEWVAEHLGVALPLERFAEDADRRSLWGAERGAVDLAGSWEDARALDHRVDFAEQLHFVDDFLTARKVLDTVFRDAPAHEGATLLRGDIAVHESDWPAALAWTSRARQLFPDSASARIDRIDALIGSGLWEEALAEIASGLEAVPVEKRRFHRNAHRARVRLALDHELDDALREDLAWLRASGVVRDRWTADATEAEWHLRRGRIVEASGVAVGALSGTTITPSGIWGAILRAVAWETAPDAASRKAAVLSAWDVELLVANDRAPWVEQLRAAGLVPRQGRTRRQADLALRRGPLVRVG
jgi:hypothetical protein